MNWRATPLAGYQVIIVLISATTTKTGLKVISELDDNLCPKRVVVSDEELAALFAQTDASMPDGP
jgi:DDE family transposase